MIRQGMTRAILFDFYQTIVDIKTDETRDHVWNVLAAFLRYRGGEFSAAKLRDDYQQEIHESLDRSHEAHPEVDIVRVFETVLEQNGVEVASGLGRILGQLFRSLTIERLALFPESRHVLETLAERYRLGLVSDSQACCIGPELRAMGLEGLFEVVVISSELGYRKPDPRMFDQALERMRLSHEEVVYVGDSWERDMAGALASGIRGIWIRRSNERVPFPLPPSIAVIDDLHGLLG